MGPNLGQSYIIDSFLVVVFGGVGNLWGTLVGGMSMGVVNQLLEPYAGAVLAKIFVLVALILVGVVFGLAIVYYYNDIVNLLLGR